jgi:hypothetical protein
MSGAKTRHRSAMQVFQSKSGSCFVSYERPGASRPQLCLGIAASLGGGFCSRRLPLLAHGDELLGYCRMKRDR